MSESLRQVLSTFQTIDDERGDDESPLRNVWYIRNDSCLEQVVLQLGDMFLVVAANQDDDTVILSTALSFDTTTAENVSTSGTWHDLIGKSFGWGWATVNQQGYCDGIMLSFSGIEPKVCLNVIASSIKVAAVGAFSES